MTPTLFALLIEDRTPLAFRHFPGLFQSWLQDAGGFAAVGLVLYLLYALRMPKDQAASARDRAGVSTVMLGSAVVALLLYATHLFLMLSNIGPDAVNVPKTAAEPGAFVKQEPSKWSWNLQPVVLSLAGLFAIVGIGEPFARSLARMRFGRLFALAKLAFKEAVRSRLVWVFLLFLVPALFPITWFFPAKAEDQIRLSLGVSTFWVQVLLLLPAALVAALALPNDIKNQNIYTVVSKPVERFEIVLGRFLGYAALFTLALAGMTALGWVLIRTTDVNEQARATSDKARVPVRGELSFRSRAELRGEKFEGTNVGREFDYRRYIAGDPASSQRAVWGFGSVPGGLAEGRDHVPCEFGFDIFRMTKGQENRGVDLVIRVVSWQCPQAPPDQPGEGAWRWTDAGRERDYQRDYDARRRDVNRRLGRPADDPRDPLKDPKHAAPGGAAWPALNELAKDYGFYEVSGVEVFDYHTTAVAVPVGVFQNAAAGDPKPAADGKAPPRVQVYVKCDTRGQLLGMAEPDLYLLEGERSFDQNYFKAAVGVWCRLLIVLGLAVCLSTYLAGILAFLGAVMLYLLGYVTEHILDLASSKSVVGGPFRAMNQLLQAQQPTAPADPNNPIESAADLFDNFFSWVVRRFVNVVPDVNAFSWTAFVAEGFDVPGECLVMNVVVAVGYLLPWFVLAFYLLRSREVAA